MNFASLGVDDPIGHHPDTRGAGNYASHIYFVAVQELDNLEGGIDAGGFGDGFHEGIMPLMFHSAKNHTFTHAEVGRLYLVVGQLSP